MALMKCPECGKEMSEQAKKCPNCGYVNSFTICSECGAKLSEGAAVCPHCGNVLKKKKPHKKVFPAIQKIVVGACLVFWGIVALSCSSTSYYSGEYAEHHYYGGDAYTGMQNAAATTANNVDNLGDTVEEGFSSIEGIMAGILIITGGYFISTGIYCLAKKD